MTELEVEYWKMKIWISRVLEDEDVDQDVSNHGIERQSHERG